MQCPVCHYNETKVIDSRVSAEGLAIRRRRECLKCGFRFSTYEEVEILDLSVLKKDGHKEAYDRKKIESGLRKAFEKRPISEDDFRKLINRIERDIQLTKKNEIKSDDIGEIVTKELKKSDPVAYVRFTSVYQDFKNVDQFLKVINEVFKKHSKKK